jgi:hypothetical protein
MPDKETKYPTIKELGNLQEKILFYLAENPDKHKQAIQKGINHPLDQYSSIQNAVKSLSKMGYLESKKALSLKKLTIELYSCTEVGLIYALGKNSNANIQRILTEYQSKNLMYKSFLGICNELGKEEIARFFNGLVDFLPMIQAEGLEKALTLFIVKLMANNKGIDERKRIKNAKVWLKYFPDRKPVIKDWHDNIKDLLR